MNFIYLPALASIYNEQYDEKTIVSWMDDSPRITSSTLVHPQTLL